MRENLPDHWQVSVEEVGATATLLTENLRERNGHLSVVHATLLLLGIYEDTGSLSYAGTTPRDVRAVAWLLERGASLQLAADFLNRPLSPAQRAIYGDLAANAQTLEIHGPQVIIACGDAHGLDEEISSLAHKLRDLYDPDALFVLLSTMEGVRLVARSATDHINVADIAAEFGGGGHGRAAAALIRVGKTQSSPKIRSETCQKLREMLPRYVQSPITVAEIMSRGPQTLSPQTSADEAAHLMQRFGYEGYPVVDAGKVIGLLTRRAVDRAIAHKLNLTAASLMDAGDVSVLPEDSLQTLQKRMTDSGWGQVPVVDAQSKALIGIVTRTDLLKTLTPHKAGAGAKNLAERLQRALPEAHLDLIHKVAEAAAAQQVALYVVGGFVRDLLLERPSLDFDMVVEGDAIALAHTLAEKYGGRVTDHSRFGTAKWFLKDADLEDAPVAEDKPSTAPLPAFLDFISARKEFYSRPTALPTVSRGSIKLDLHRRDFTINTLALRLDGRHYGELHDYWGGLDALERGIVRVLHSLSFVDDPTRMLRAVRFEQRFDFRIGERTLELMDEARPLLERLSGQRIGHELDLILDEPRAPDMLARLDELHLLTAIHPALRWDEELARRCSAALDTPLPAAFTDLADASDTPLRRALGYLLWLLPLSVDEMQGVFKRLHFHASLERLLLSARQLLDDLPAQKNALPSQWTARLTHLPLLAVYAVFLSADDAGTRDTLKKYAESWRYIRPKTDGNALRERGLRPGPRYREILSRLRAAWLDGEVSSAEDETKMLEKLLQA
ncbi:MAG: CBS domain-containing protein [Anaerolineales bacterium]|nr:CBS domain-containing protein [Anaerolineales bacterium]